MPAGNPVTEPEEYEKADPVLLVETVPRAQLQEGDGYHQLHKAVTVTVLDSNYLSTDPGT